MKSKLKILLTILICFLCATTIVKADYEDNTTSGGGSSNAGSGCKDTDSCWYSGYYGLRVSLYIFEQSQAASTPTNKIGKTVDYIGNDIGGQRSSGQLNRIQILNGSSPSFVSDKGNTLSAGWLSNMYQSPGRIPTEVEKHVMGACYGKKSSDYANSSEYIKAVEACMTPFFEEMGATNELRSFFQNVLTNKNTKDIFIVYEPIAGIGVTGHGKFMVTGTELAWMYDGSTYSVSWISTLIRSYTEGGSIKGVHVAATAYQASKAIAGFTPINLATTTLGKHEHNKNRYGVSVGVARLSEIVDIKTPLICVEKDGKYYGKTPDVAVNITKYQQECFPQDEPDICTFDLVTKIVKDCKNGTEGYVKDIDNWECIYASRDSSNANIRNHFYMNTENRYCSIFCREEVYYYYPGSGLTVRSGHHFAVGQTGAANTLLPVNMTGRSECRINYGTGGGKTGQINYTLFESDWKNANNRITSAWNTMNIERAKSISIQKAQRSSYRNCANFCDDNVKGIECCSAADRDWDDCRYGSPCGGKDSKGNCIDTCRGGWGPWYCIQRDYPYNHGYWYTPQAQYYNGGYYSASGWCSHCGNSYRPETCSTSTGLSSAISSYNSALVTRNQYLTQLMQCNNFQRTYRDFNPTIQFKYNEGEYESLNYNYQYSDILDKELEIRAQTNYFTGVPEAGSLVGIKQWNTSTYKNASSEIIYDVDNGHMVTTHTSMPNCYASGGSRYCPTSAPYRDLSINNVNRTYGKKSTIQGYQCLTYGQNCNNAIINVTYPVNDSLRMWTTKEYDYKLFPGVYNYVRKDTGQSLHTAPSKNYYVVGYSNLPTHYSRKTRSDYHFYLDFSPEIFGVNQKFYKFLKLGANAGITYGSEQTLTIYEKLWNNTRLNSMINDCREGGEHLNHSFVSAINSAGITTNAFLTTPCAKQFNCKLSGSKVTCSGDVKCSSCSHSSSTTACCNRNYQQLRACIQSQVVDRVGKPLFTDTDYTYKCTYRILNEIVCPPDSGCKYIGVSAIYRTVDLNDPFPDRSPTGNWTSITESNYILNNRGVHSTQLYTRRDPMYKITLTPSLISSIKQYNETHDMSDYNLECNTAGNECKSNFIRKTYSSYFSGCGISGKGSSRCNPGEAW